MDHLQEARDFTEFACERWDQGKYEWAAMNIEIAKAHALIALVERLDSVIYGDEHGNRYIRVTSE